MNTESLKTFLIVADTKNFRKASQQLHITQSTVSSRIQELENHLGQKLFERASKGLSLTPAGYKLVPYAENMVTLERTMLDNISRSNTRMRFLNIGISDSIYYAYMRRLVPDFLKAHPEISLNFTSKSSPDMMNYLQDNQVDICISFLPNYDKSYETLTLVEDEIILATGRHNTEYVNGISKEALGRIPVYASLFFHVNRDMKQWYASTFPANFHYRIQTDVIWNLIYFLKNGDGYALLPRTFILDELENGSLISIPMDFDRPPHLYMYACLKKQLLQEHKVQCFLDEVIKKIQKRNSF